MQLELSLSTQTKQCSKCKRILPRSEFSKNRGAKDGLFGWCKPCSQQQASERYWSSDSARSESAERSRIHRRRVRGLDDKFIPVTVYTPSTWKEHQVFREVRRISILRFVKVLKSVVPCQLCGEREGICLDLHHINPGEKEFEIVSASRSRKSITAVVVETMKCAMLCANCHRKIHGKILCIDGIQPITRAQVEQAIKALDNSPPRAGN